MIYFVKMAIKKENIKRILSGNYWQNKGLMVYWTRPFNKILIKFTNEIQYVKKCKFKQG